jgi:murein DD-endopeptidase MepM/ murein hydrolase activator NlpD
MRRLPVPFLLLLLSTPPAGAAEGVRLELDGSIPQGGLLVARTEPGATAELDGRPVRVSPEGVFLVGAGRDDEGPLAVIVMTADRRQASASVSVNPREYRIQRIDGLPAGKVTPPAEVLERIRREAALTKAARARDDERTDFLTGFEWPLEGPITGIYGSQRILNGEPRRPHFGVDVAAPVGTPVRAPADAVVSLAHADMYYSGGTLVMDHGHGLSSTFIHLSRILVAEGDRVEKGQVVAEVGATGRVTGPHLDWRMNLFDVRLDPELLVVPQPGYG